ERPDRLGQRPLAYGATRGSYHWVLGRPRVLGSGLRHRPGWPSGRVCYTPSAFVKSARRPWTATLRPRVFSKSLASPPWRWARPKSTRAVTSGALRDGSFSGCLGRRGRRTTG